MARCGTQHERRTRRRVGRERGACPKYKLSGREVGSARRAKKNHAEREVLDVVGVCWIRTYRTMADIMKASINTLNRGSPSDFDSGAELNHPLRWDQEVIRRADGIAHHESIDPFLPQGHFRL